MSSDEIDVVLEMYRRLARVHLRPGRMSMPEAVRVAQERLCAALLSEPRPCADCPGAMRLTIEAEATIQAVVLRPDPCHTGNYAAFDFDTI